MRKACMLLENTQMPIQEIVALCGYANQNFFYKKVPENHRKHTGGLPDDGSEVPEKWSVNEWKSVIEKPAFFR